MIAPIKIYLTAFTPKRNIYFSVACFIAESIICAMTSARLIVACLARGKTVYLHPDVSTLWDARELPAWSVQYEVNGHASINRTVRWTVTPRISADKSGKRNISLISDAPFIFERGRCSRIRACNSRLQPVNGATATGVARVRTVRTVRTECT